jgi:hypothetical protein
MGAANTAEQPDTAPAAKSAGYLSNFLAAPANGFLADLAGLSPHLAQSCVR